MLRVPKTCRDKSGQAGQPYKQRVSSVPTTCPDSADVGAIGPIAAWLISAPEVALDCAPGHEPPMSRRTGTVA